MVNNPSPEERLEQVLADAAATEQARPAPDAEAFLQKLRPRLAEPPVPATNWWRIAALIPVVLTLVVIAWWMQQPSPELAPEQNVAVIEDLDFLEEMDRLFSLEEAGTIDLETVKVLEDWELLLELDGLPDELLVSSG